MEATTPRTLRTADLLALTGASRNQLNYLMASRNLRPRGRYAGRMVWDESHVDVVKRMLEGLRPYERKVRG